MGVLVLVLGWESVGVRHVPDLFCPIAQVLFPAPNVSANP
jgi:hypothetical protein